MESRPMLERAIEIAAKAHAGQLDKGGQPYILHPLRVMLALTSDEARMAAVLHDVLEDTYVSIVDLRLQGFPQTVLDAVEALTRREGETYTGYVLRASENPIARAVKLADLRDNMDPSRPGAEKHQARYQEAHRLLTTLSMVHMGNPS